MPSVAPLISLLGLVLSLGYPASAATVQGVGNTPRSTLAFTTRINVTGFSNILAADQARAAALFQNAEKRAAAKASGKKRAAPISATNTAVTYTANIGVGSPPTDYTLLIDTGSSNTWVGADKAYVETSTSVNTNDEVFVEYGSGLFIGTEFIDTVTISPDLVITNQSIGVAEIALGFNGVDGILGIGPIDLTENTVGDTDTVPTVTDNLLEQGAISSEVIGVYFAPTTSLSVTNGELTFGDVDTSRTTSDISFVPLTTVSPADEYWGIDQSIAFGSTSILTSSSGIVDTGTTLVLLGTDPYNAYVSATGATLDQNSGLLTISAAQFSALEPLDFVIGGSTFTLSPNAQIWPRALNTAIGGTSDGIYLIVGDLGSDLGAVEFINGYTFLERFYSVFDTTNGRVGFATTAHTTDTSN